MIIRRMIATKPHTATSVLLASSLSLLVSAVAVFVWGQSNNWQIIGMSPYRLFPVFGLLAFSILWSQYMVIFMTKIGWLMGHLKNYFEITGFFVLLCILLHPSILIFQLWHDGFGLPPQSYLQHFIAPGLEWAALLGTLSLLTFLSYELRRWFDKKRWWRFVGYACDVAMLAIFVHGLTLGDQLQGGWFRTVWLIYGVLLAVALIYIHGGDSALVRRARKVY